MTDRVHFGASFSALRNRRRISRGQLQAGLFVALAVGIGLVTLLVTAVVAGATPLVRGYSGELSRL